MPYLQPRVQIPPDDIILKARKVKFLWYLGLLTIDFHSSYPTQEGLPSFNVFLLDTWILFYQINVRNNVHLGITGYFIRIPAW
jgi:hypothetical protein